MTSAPAIGFEYVPSRTLRRAVMMVCLLAWMAIVLCAVPIWLKMLLLGGSALSGWQALRLLSMPAVVAVGWSRESGWSLHLRDSSDVAASLISFRMMAAFVLLRLRTEEQGVQVILLAPDNSDPDTRRRLRMRLATMEPGEALPRL